MSEYQFSCRFGILGDLGQTPLPSQDLLIPQPDGQSLSLRQVFFNASVGSIELEPDFSRLDAGVQAGLDKVWATDMEWLLKKLVDNPAGVYPVPQLGVLFAPRYGPDPNVYGVMFDSLQGLPGDPDNGQGNQIPREGCAVFLGTILDKLQGIPNLVPDLSTAYARQVAFTTVHEIGHLFNLQHVDPAAPGGAPCFLNTSSADGPPPAAHYQFTDDECTALCNVDSYEVAPGGSDFGSTGIWDAPPARTRLRQVPAGHLKLTISTTPDSFWTWEPIELDLLLQRGKHPAAARRQVPNQIDPGYPRVFQLWITDPRGERRLFRTPRHYCAYEQALAFGPGAPFRRDVSLFLEPGGYTFRQAGIYELQVRLLLPGGWGVESNVLPVQIHSRAGLSRPLRQQTDDLRRLLVASARAFYYRRVPLDRRSRQALETLADKYRRQHAGAAAMSVLGRDDAWRASRSPSHRAHWTRLAKPWLKKVIHHGQVGENRRKNARLALERIG